MAKRTSQPIGIICLASLSLSLLIVGNAQASPLMSVHGDSAGRRLRTSTSWAPSSYPLLTEDGINEMFNPMFKSRTSKSQDRVRPFNFRPIESGSDESNALMNIGDAGSFSPFNRGGSSEMMPDEGPSDINGLKNFVADLKTRLRDEISLLLALSNEESVQKADDFTRKFEDEGKGGKKIFGMRSLLHPPATFGKRKFVPTQLI